VPLVFAVLQDIRPDPEHEMEYSGHVINSSLIGHATECSVVPALVASSHSSFLLLCGRFSAARNPSILSELQDMSVNLYERRVMLILPSK
jgi:hypothetical protein